jgi:hypothetical protein
MFGIRFIKVPPTTYVLQYRKGALVREGSGLAFFYFAPSTLLAAVPIGSKDAQFIFNEMTSDFQEVTVQGQATYRVGDPKRVAALLDFSLDPRTGLHASEDPEKLDQRVVNLINVLTRKELQGLPLKAALTASDALIGKLSEELRVSEEMSALGLEIMGVSILAIKANPNTARALEAEAREEMLRKADEAVYTRRNAAVEQERAIRESELNTEIAVETKKRQVREAQMDAEIAVVEKRGRMNHLAMESKIRVEEQNKELTALQAENQKRLADVKAHGIRAMVQAMEGADPKAIRALALLGMQPDQLIAMAFQEMAERADKIGELNVSPDLLKELLSKKPEAPRGKTQR